MIDPKSLEKFKNLPDSQLRVAIKQALRMQDATILEIVIIIMAIVEPDKLEETLARLKEIKT